MIVSAIFDTEDGTQLALTRLREAGIEVQRVSIRRRDARQGENDGGGEFLAAGGAMLGAGFANMGGGAVPAMGLGLGMAPLFMGKLDGGITHEYSGDESDRETKLEVYVRDEDAERAAGVLRNAHGRHVKAS